MDEIYFSSQCNLDLASEFLKYVFLIDFGII